VQIHLTRLPEACLSFQKAILDKSDEKYISIALGAIMQMGAQAETNDVMQLWSGTAPGTEKWVNATNLEAILVRPTLTIFLPASDKANGTGLLILPGGSYAGCCYTYEGFDIARWCNERGIACQLPSCNAYTLIPSRQRMPVARCG